MARLLAEKLTIAYPGRTFIVENRPGAGGNIAAGVVARSEVDGNTLLVTSTNHTINLSLYKKPGYVLDDFVPIAQIGLSGFVIVAHPSTKFKTLADLVNAARMKPSSISFGTGGNGHPAHLAAEMLMSRTKIAMQHVPYKGTGPLTTDLIGGQIPVGIISTIAAQPFVLSGQLVGLGVTTKRRWPDMPDVPTIEEGGVPGYEYSAWIGVLGRMGMPENDALSLEQKLLAIASTDEVRAALHKQGNVAMPKGREGFKAIIAHDASVNRDLVKELGVQIE